MIEVAGASSSPRSWAGAAAASGLAVVTVAVWILATPMPALRAELRVLQFWWLEACVFLGLAVAGAVIGELARTLDRRDIAAALLPALLGVGLTVTLPPRTNRIFYDEQIYQNVGRNLADSKRAQLCNDGAIRNGRLQCSAAEYNKQPYAFPHVLSLAYRTFGVRPWIPFAVNAAAMGLSVALTYLLGRLLFADRLAALCAATIFAVLPEQIVWSASGAAEPSAVLAAIAALVAAACFVESRSTTALAGVAIATAYAVQFRPESLLIVPIVVLLLWQRAPDELAAPRTLWAALLFVALAAPHFAHVVAVRNEGWGTSQERLAITYAVQNLRVNGWFFLHDARFPTAVTLLAVVGWMVPRGRAGRAAIATYFLLFFAITLLFYAGSYDYGADVRYSLLTNPPVAILAGFGAAWLMRWTAHRPLRIALCLILMAAAAAQYAVESVPIVRATVDSAWAARADVEFARSFVPKLPPDSYVLTHNPGMFQVWGVNAGQMSFATDSRFLGERASQFHGGIYLHWNYWCNTQDRVHQALCATVRSLRPVELAGEMRSQDQHFAFYRMNVSRADHSNP